MECGIHTNYLIFEENLRHPQKCNQGYFKPSLGSIWSSAMTTKCAEKSIGHNYKEDERKLAYKTEF